MTKMLNQFFIIIVENKEVKSNFDKEMNSSIRLAISDKYASYLYDDEEMVEYKNKRDKAISDVKVKLYGSLTLLEIGLLAVYLGMLPIEKKNILKYTIDE